MGAPNNLNGRVINGCNPNCIVNFILVILVIRGSVNNHFSNPVLNKSEPNRTEQAVRQLEALDKQHSPSCNLYRIGLSRLFWVHPDYELRRTDRGGAWQFYHLNLLKCWNEVTPVEIVTAVSEEDDLRAAIPVNPLALVPEGDHLSSAAHRCSQVTNRFCRCVLVPYRNSPRGGGR